MNKIMLAVLLAVLLIGTSAPAFGAYDVPRDGAGVRYFYVFGTDGEATYGAEDNELELYIEVPSAESQKLTIGIYDPDAGDTRDWKENSANKWDTVTEFSVYSGSKKLDSKQFGRDKAYDRKYYTFGPYDISEGEEIQRRRRFKLMVKGIRGDDANLFSIRISPDTAQSFAYDITFRLMPREGDIMNFYPLVPPRIDKITVENYDIDRDGGVSTLYDPFQRIKYDINDSSTAQWAKTVIPLKRVAFSQKLKYTIVKARQRHGHAGLRIFDDQGKPVPIYFRRSAPKIKVVAKAKPAPVKVAPKPQPIPVVRAKKPEAKACNTFTFDATDSYDPDKQKLSYLWEFGDGASSNQPVTTHTYAKGGDYTVNLKVQDDSGLPCDTATVSQKIRVNTPPIASFTAPKVVCITIAAKFDASSSTDDNSSNLAYKWNFGDGATADGKVVNHSFAKGGNYNVSLLVDDNEGTTCSVTSVNKTILVNTPPEANAGKDVDLCLAANETYKIPFDGTGSRDADGDKLSYDWNFGDGNTGSGAKTSHIYKTGGTYTVSLKVNDGSGSSCSQDTDTVIVKLNRSPVADAGNSLVCCVGSENYFDASNSFDPDGDKLTYHWDFGDGTTGTGVKVQHEYKKPGLYKITLIVDDGSGTFCSKSIDSFEATVNDTPVAVIKVKQK